MIPYIVLFVILATLYLYQVNLGMKAVPDKAEKLSPKRWTDEEIQATYRRVSEKPLDFTAAIPPKQNRRYIVVGGSGLVGGAIVLHLLTRGQSPESIRVVDFAKPRRADLLTGKASQVGFVQVDITDKASTEEAFSKAWPSSVAALPLTVFHCAAIIRPGERRAIHVPRSADVNVKGVSHVVDAARAAGADILVSTSSGAVSVRPVTFWILPWQPYPDNIVQVHPDPDKDDNIRPREHYFGNYPWSKALGEKIVVDANSKKFKTGCIRPGTLVYGNQYDLALGPSMRDGKIQTWIPHIFQGWVHTEHVSLAHLYYEAALIQAPDKVGGKAFTVTDPNPPPTFGDTYRVCALILDMPVINYQPVVLWTLAHIIELWAWSASRYPTVKSLFGEPKGNLSMLQPPVFITSGIFQVSPDDPIRKPVKQGGLGYKSVCTTLEGVVDQARQFKVDKAKA